MQRIRPELVLGLLVAGFACSSNGESRPPELTGPRIPVTIETEGGPVTFQAEVVDTPESRARGLMFRESMGRLEGMLFLFPDEAQRSFWMKNTLIPLDMLFIRSDRTILGVAENAVPKTTSSRRVEGGSQFVLEINGGLSKELGLKAGQKVTFYAPVPSR